MSKTNKGIKDEYSTLATYGLLRDPELTGNDVKVFLYLKLRYQYFEHVGGSFFESYPTIASAISMNKKTIERSVQTLKKRGYINIKKENGRNNTYTIIEQDGVPF